MKSFLYGVEWSVSTVCLIAAVPLHHILKAVSDNKVSYNFKDHIGAVVLLWSPTKSFYDRRSFLLDYSSFLTGCRNSGTLRLGTLFPDGRKLRFQTLSNYA